MSFLLPQAGCNPNAKKMCGTAPLVIEVIKKNKQDCNLLVEQGANVRRHLFTNIPRLHTFAEKKCHWLKYMSYSTNKH